MTLAKQKGATPQGKNGRASILALIMITSLMLGLLVSTPTQPIFASASARPSINYNGANGGSPDPDVYMYGTHLFDPTPLYIPFSGENLTLYYPTNWNVTSLGINFYNGTLERMFVANTTAVTTTVTAQVVGGYAGVTGNLKMIPVNSTVYQIQFQIEGLKLATVGAWTTVTDSSNSTYPPIDGNIGIAQKFLLTTHTGDLNVQVRLLKFMGTGRNLTVEVRSATSDNRVGGLIKSVSFSPDVITEGSQWIAFSIPDANLDPGQYFIVLHTQGWLASGGGYQAETTLSKNAGSSPSGYVTYDRGVTWYNAVNISTSSYFFNGFKMNILAVPSLTPSELNLKISGIPVADNFIWNQSVWSNAYPYQFSFTSDHPLTQLNFTYKAWYYAYGTSNLFKQGYHIQISDMSKVPIKNTTASGSPGSFQMMRATLDQTNLNRAGVVDRATGTVNLNFKLFNGTHYPLNGSVNIIAWAQLLNKTSIQFGGTYSLVLQSTYYHSAPQNVSLAENALVIGPVNSQIDNVFMDGNLVNRNLWSYNLRTKTITVYRDAFTNLQQFTLLSGSSYDCTIKAFNNFTASASTSIIGSQPETTPVATINVVNSTPLIDLDGLSLVNITITDPSGVLINNTAFTLLGNTYAFSWILTGEGVYGIKVIANDTSGHFATRWIGAATVNDYKLAPPAITLNATSLMGLQILRISGNVSYVNHPEFLFSGTLNITIYIGSSGVTQQIYATYNATAKSYSATYQAPNVQTTTTLNINVQACDLKGRISANETSASVTPIPSPPIPQPEPSNLGIIQLLVAAVILLVLVATFIIEKRRK